MSHIELWLISYNKKGSDFSIAFFIDLQIIIHKEIHNGPVIRFKISFFK